MTDTRDVEERAREEASRHLDAFPSARRIVADRLYEAANAIAAERAARERAEAEAQRWRESAAMLQNELDVARDREYVRSAVR